MSKYIKSGRADRSVVTASIALAFAIFLGACSSAPKPKTSPDVAPPPVSTQVETPPSLPSQCRQFCADISTYAKDAGHDDLGSLLCDLARCESGNRCPTHLPSQSSKRPAKKIRSANGRYHGVFQFSPATWRAQCGPIFVQKGLSRCCDRNGMDDLRCSTTCTAEIVARRGLGDWPACGRKITSQRGRLSGG